MFKRKPQNRWIKKKAQVPANDSGLGQQALPHVETAAIVRRYGLQDVPISEKISGKTHENCHPDDEI